MQETRRLNILGIESSCDETSVAILSDDKVKANLISSQHFHKAFGGVVPELATQLVKFDQIVYMFLFEQGSIFR